ncbi:sensor histidine kinase [Aestuariibaculum suncheonense]|uniref:Histidine kinase n=1 Tax=Aestuariibaculum suncheonense TaxID=1028745 RepID=A0A8J6QI17_9FLAO|nr:histidine kinase [Aestuariibaculum suncheonense]MBD0836750.1 histidine kinase [Aestuariibaculum suncheonense]
MKHIKPTLLILLLLGIFIYPYLDNLSRAKINNPEWDFSQKKFLKKEPDPNWEYLKDRLTSGDGNGRFINRYKTPILFELFEASKEDSLAVNNTIKELRDLLPHKTIDYFNNYIGMSSQEVIKSGIYHNPEQGYKYKGNFKILDLTMGVIKMYFDGYDTTLPKSLLHRTSRTDLGLGNYISRTYKNKSYSNYFDVNYIYFSLSNAVPYLNKEACVKYEMLRSLCDIKNNPQANTSNVPSAVFNFKEYYPQSYVFTYQDEFLLKKLYSPDFDQQFEDYIYSHYNWRYAMHYLSSDELKTVSAMVLALLVLCLVVCSKDFFINPYFKLSYLNYLVPALIVFSSIVGLNGLYNHLSNLDLLIYSTWSHFFMLLVFMVITPGLVVSFFIWGLEKIFIKNDRSFYTKLFLKSGLLFLAIIIPFSIYSYVLSKYIVYEGVATMSIINPVFAIALVVAIARGVLLYLKSYSDNIIKQKDLELSELKALNTKAELKSLQSQINPHFLYNALNSIAELSHTDANKTERMALSLSDLFRYSINRQGKQMSTVKDEVEMVQTYLEIEQIRFGERLEFTIEIDETLINEPLPMFLLQPLVENAVKHGISKLETKGIIKLVIHKTEKGLVISVYDNGPKFPEGLVSGHGLQSVFDLLRLSYKSHAKLNWVNKPEKKIEIVIDYYL